MATVGIRELKAHTSDILRKVRDEGQTIDVTLRGEVIARIVPATRTPHAQARTAEAMHKLRELTADLRTRNLPPTDVRTLMDEERR